MDFEKATRLKLRFTTSQGILSAEDLWDIPLTTTRGNCNLNDIAKGLNRELKAAGEEDFVNKPTAANALIQLKFDLVKHVIAVRLAENEAARVAVERKEKKQRLLEIIAHKQDQELEGKSVEELTAMVNTL